MSICICGFTFLLFPLLFNHVEPTKELLPHVLQILGFHVVQNKYVNFLSILAIFSIWFGLFVAACTESSFTLCAYYACGLFKITSYRICNAIDVATKRIVSKNNATSHAGIREAMDMHTKSIKLVERN
ncbi:uncharacterized protein LOC143150434 [Ptiloglossa arizonensis]|uniref:uncharacterized protein LOC143150434 n=1 Tax=Ptiloglossa arizonensis TaxID=3350558 RepID=UPI003F9FF75D